MRPSHFHAAAEKYFKQAFQLKIRLNYKKADILFGKALAAIAKATQENPDCAQHHFLSALIRVSFCLKHQWAKALADCGRALELDPKNPAAYTLRGQIRVEEQSNRAYADVDEIKKAIHDLNHAIRLDKKQALAYVWRMDAKNHLGLPFNKRTLKDLRWAASLRPKDAWVVGKLGIVEQSLGLLPEALKTFNKALRLNPKLDWAHAFRGEILRKFGKTSLSDRELLQGKTDPVTRIRIACRHIEGKKFQKALKELQFIAKHSPGAYPIIFRLMEEAWRELGDYKRALRCLDRLASMDPSLAEWDWTFRDFIEFNPPVLKELAQRHPRYAQTSAWLARRAMSEGRAQEAMDLFEKALRLDPECSWARLWRAELFYLQGQLPSALKETLRILKRIPRHIAALSLRAQIFLIRGRNTRAVRLFDRCIHLRAVDPEPYIGKARAYLRLGRRVLALKEARKAIELQNLYQPRNQDKQKSRSALDYSGHLFRAPGIQQAGASLPAANDWGS